MSYSSAFSEYLAYCAGLIASLGLLIGDNMTVGLPAILTIAWRAGYRWREMENKFRDKDGGEDHE